MAGRFRCGVVPDFLYILSDPARLKWFAPDRPGCPRFCDRVGRAGHRVESGCAGRPARHFNDYAERAGCQ